MAKGIQRLLKRARANAQDDIRGMHNRGGLYAHGLANEGYAGGYVEALNDVELALRGVTPNNSRFWPKDQ